MEADVTTLKEDLAKAAQNGWGRGRVLVAGLWPEIEQALVAGHTRSRIWKTLRDRGEFTLSYPQFVTLVRQRLDATHTRQASLSPVQADTLGPDEPVEASPQDKICPSPPVNAAPTLSPPTSKPYNPHADISALV